MIEYTHYSKEFLMLFILIAFSMSITFMIGIRGFVSVWVGKENYILSYLTVVLFTSTLFLNIMYYPLVALINADGLFKDNKKHIFICATTNLVLSIILINFFGINGILLGTAIAFLVNILLKTNLVTKKILKRSKTNKRIKILYHNNTIICYIIINLNTSRIILCKYKYRFYKYNNKTRYSIYLSNINNHDNIIFN